MEEDLKASNSSWKAMCHCGRLAGFDMPIVQSKRHQFLNRSIDPLVHGRVPGRNIAKLLEKSGAAVVVISLGGCESLSVVSWSLSGPQLICLGMG